MSGPVTKRKIVLFVFNGDPMCVIHVLLNALDMRRRGHECGIVFEGAATKLIPDLETDTNPLHKLWVNVRQQGLVEGVCRACATKMNTIGDVKRLELPILDDMSGHPSMARYQDAGWEVMLF